MNQHPSQEALEALAEKELRNDPLTQEDLEIKEHMKTCRICHRIFGIHVALTDIIDGDLFADFMAQKVVDYRLVRQDSEKEQSDQGRGEQDGEKV